MITSNSNDTLEDILKKIQTPQDLKMKLGVYTMFIYRLTTLNFGRK